MTGQRSSNVKLLRINQVLAPDGPIPVSKSTWWSGIKCGRYPKPYKLGKNISVWRSDEIDRLVDSLSRRSPPESDLNEY